MNNPQNKPLLTYKALGFITAPGCLKYILKIFTTKYHMVPNNKNPKLIICNCKTRLHTQNYKLLKRLNPKSKILFFTGENVRLDLRLCDLGISFDYRDHIKHLRHPLWLIYTQNATKLVRDPSKKITLKNYNKPYFCGFVAGHAVKYRDMFVRKLSNKYKKVLCPGKVLNNCPRIGKSGDDKLAFLRKCKFTICYENSQFDGYLTEKIVHPFMTYSIPIYWGSQSVSTEFNPKAFLNRMDYDNDEEFIKKIIEIDNDMDKYLKMVNEFPLINNKIPDYIEKNIQHIASMNW